jgi:hypothetical protein
MAVQLVTGLKRWLEFTNPSLKVRAEKGNPGNCPGELTSFVYCDGLTSTTEHCLAIPDDQADAIIDCYCSQKYFDLILGWGFKAFLLGSWNWDFQSYPADTPSLFVYRCKNEQRQCFLSYEWDYGYDAEVKDWHKVCDAYTSLVTSILPVPPTSIIPIDCTTVFASCERGNRAIQSCTRSYDSTEPELLRSCLCDTPLLSALSVCMVDGHECVGKLPAPSGRYEESVCSFTSSDMLTVVSELNLSGSE